MQQKRVLLALGLTSELGRMIRGQASTKDKLALTQAYGEQGLQDLVDEARGLK